MLAVIQFSGCIAAAPYPAPRAPRADAYNGNMRRSAASESWEAQRLRRIVMPLVRAMDRPCPMNEMRLGLVRQNEINAANAGGCQFYVTTALVQGASDDQLRGVLAHEIAHEDLGHVAKAQVLGAGINAGVALLEQLLAGKQRVDTAGDAHRPQLWTVGGICGRPARHRDSPARWLSQRDHDRHIGLDTSRGRRPWRRISFHSPGVG